VSDSPTTLDGRPDPNEEWLRSLQPQPYDAEAWRPLDTRPRGFWSQYGLNLVFFVLTLLSVNLTGGPMLVVGLMPILIAHEMGHYVACLRYRVDATLPYFIPLPVLSFVGTLGAFIRIRGPIPNRRALFDIGIAGPLAGFVVCVPVIVLGALEASVIPTPPTDSPNYFSFGEPLLLQWTYEWIRGQPPAGHTFLMGPLAMASWFGLFVTALNLMPVGQLDGGHVVYALLGKRSIWVSRVALLGCFGLLYLRPTWLLWCILLSLFGRRHPRTLDDDAPVGAARVLVGVVGLLVFAASFTPSPIIVTWPDFWLAIFSLLRLLFSLFTSG
jgi:membrane-associated protease RseP (regulator of RpoE activity)